MKSLVLTLALIFTSTSHAVLPVVDAGVFYFTDSMVYSSQTSSYSRTFFDFMVGLPLSNKGRWVLGWNYDSYSFKDNPGTATTLTISDMGPKILFSLSKDNSFVLGLTYNLITKGSYTPGGGTKSELRGSSLRAELGYQPAVSEHTYLGLKLNYYKATFNEEITGQTALAKVTDSRTVIYPSLAYTYRFD